MYQNFTNCVLSTINVCDFLQCSCTSIKQFRIKVINISNSNKKKIIIIMTFWQVIYKWMDIQVSENSNVKQHYSHASIPYSFLNAPLSFPFIYPDPFSFKTQLKFHLLSEPSEFTLSHCNWTHLSISNPYTCWVLKQCLVTSLVLLLYCLNHYLTSYVSVVMLSF